MLLVTAHEWQRSTFMSWWCSWNAFLRMFLWHLICLLSYKLCSISTVEQMLGCDESDSCRVQMAVKGVRPEVTNHLAWSMHRIAPAEFQHCCFQLSNEKQAAWSFEFQFPHLCNAGNITLPTGLFGDDTSKVLSKGWCVVNAKHREALSVKTVRKASTHFSRPEVRMI